MYHDLGAVTGQLQRDRATDPNRCAPQQRTLPFTIPSTVADIAAPFAGRRC